MDFDHRFDREEFRNHLKSLGLLQFTGEAAFDDLLERSTQKTRRGEEFSFKPTEVLVGDTRGLLGNGGDFFPRFHAEIESRMPDPQANPGSNKNLLSSVWFRYVERVSTE
jgi:hypothetical protein